MLRLKFKATNWTKCATCLFNFVPHSGQKRTTLASSIVGVGVGAGVSAIRTGFSTWGMTFGLPIRSYLQIPLPKIAPNNINPPPIKGATTAKPGL